MVAERVEQQTRRVPRYLVALFFGGLLLLGGLVFADYGVSWDEPVDRNNGLVNVHYVAALLTPDWDARQPLLRAQPPLAGYRDNDHGVLFEMPLAWLDVVRPGTDPRTTYLLRHGAVFLVCWAGTWALYRLGRRYLRDERLGLLAAGLLWLSPRFFAESFYNGKDLVFVALFTVAGWQLARLLARPTVGRAVVAGLAIAAATDVRVLGLLLLPIGLSLLVAPAVLPPAETDGRPGGLRWRALAGAGWPRWTALALCLATMLGTIAGWPYLWANPPLHFYEAFRSMARFGWNGYLLYAGQVYQARELPWHYPLVWLNITTPLAYQAAALVGLAIGARALVRQPVQQLHTLAGRLEALLLGWLLLPLVLVIGLRSVLYDGWRHLYFIYPALLLLAVQGGRWLWQQRRRSPGWRRLVLTLAGLAAAEATFTAGCLVWLHPQQQVYFSYLPASAAAQLFERDYWGLSYRQGLEWLVRQQPQGTIYFDAMHLPPVDNNKIWLSPADQARLVYRPGAAGRYFLSAYRHFPGTYPDSVGQEVFTVRAGRLPVMSIFRRDRAGSTPYVDPHPAPPAW